MSIIETAKDYISRGWPVVPILAGEKRPVLPGWTKLQITESEVENYFQPDSNVGVILGNGLGDVDIDLPLAVELAPQFLLPTGSKFGRDSKPRSHLIYKFKNGKTYKRQTPEKPPRMIVEIRYAGCQTVFPGSTHPSGERIEWDTDDEPATVEYDELKEAVDRLADEVLTRMGLEVPAREQSLSALERATEFIHAEPPAISGQGGHNQTFHVCCELFRFGLSDADAATLMAEYNQRCQPPWTDGEIEHKLTDARETVKTAGEFGIRLQPTKPADLDSIARKLQATKDVKGGYFFSDFATTNEAIKAMGGEFTAPEIDDREVRLWIKDGFLLAEIQTHKSDPDRLTGWVRRTKKWDRSILELPTAKKEPIDTEDIRHVIAPDGNKIGWTVNIRGNWVDQSKDNCRSVLMFKGLTNTEATQYLGGSILGGWELVDLPFQPEYPEPGKPVWNRFGAQFVCDPVAGSHPHFDMVLNHVGESLDAGVEQNKWCRDRGILTGADYLLTWAASLFQNPYQLLPYLFFFGRQNSGKTSYHEMLGSLLTRGHVKVDKAFTRNTTFNAEMSGAILAVIEEADLTKHMVQAYNAIKDYTTSRNIAIERKGWDPYETRNLLHIVQVGQTALHCPIVDPYDSRIVVGHVKELSPTQRISEHVMRTAWVKEGPAFLHTLLNHKLPTRSPEDDRLYLAVLETAAKCDVIEGIAKLQQVEASQRSAAVIAQQIAEPIRKLAIEGWIVERTMVEVVSQLRSMGVENLPDNPKQIGQALAFVQGIIVKRSRTGDARRINIEMEYEFAEAASDDAIYADAMRVAQLGF